MYDNLEMNTVNLTRATNPEFSLIRICTLYADNFTISFTIQFLKINVKTVVMNNRTLLDSAVQNISKTIRD